MKRVLFRMILSGALGLSFVASVSEARDKDRFQVCGEVFEIQGPGVWPLVNGQRMKVYRSGRTLVSISNERVVFLIPEATGCYRATSLDRLTCRWRELSPVSLEWRWQTPVVKNRCQDSSTFGD